ncbi:MAG: ComEC/Rec2 family competence protein [Mobilitalea sp.]
MAYIYRYHIRNKYYRNEIKLLNYKDEIIRNINDLFFENLKDIRITENFFEFKLYMSTENNLLREMGRRLKYVWYDYRECKNGFVRAPQELYALVYPVEEQDSSRFYVEFIDTMDIDEMDRLSEQAHHYILKYRNENDISSNNEVTKDTGHQNMFYIDVLNTFIKKDNVLLIGEEPKNELRCFHVRGYHRVINDEMSENVSKYSLKDNTSDNLRNRIYFYESIDVAYLHNKVEFKNQERHSDCFDIIDHIKVNKEKIKEIFDKLDYRINKAVKIEELDNIDGKDNLVFCVHNVGQGLATSLSTRGNSNHLYFDYGMSEGENIFTEPTNITALVNINSTIILSHIHRDHWYRLVKDINAFKCKWFVPDQDINIEFKHRCAEILATGGNVHKIADTINFRGGSLFCGRESKYNPGRVTNHKHETGLALRLEMKDERGEDINILISGDQRFDYMEEEYLINLDILVASHHGGEYSWSKRANVSDDIPSPRNTETATIIYSFGIGNDGTSNTHNHPSKVNEYQSRGWKKAYNTSSSGDYILSLRNR